MMELEIGGQRYPVPTGETVVGADPSSGIRLVGERVQRQHAYVVGAPDGSVSVRPAAPDAEVMLNGVRLGPEPAPVLHGDKLQFGSVEVLVTDPRRSGSTQFVSAAEMAQIAAMARGGARPHGATATTGGRLVCLTDGREYTVGSAPLVFGREAGCDIVVPSKDVSRRHAEILATPQGYVVVDSSTNGTFVNGERIGAQRVLTRADVIRIGDHDFRFYADATPAAASAPSPPVDAPRPAPVPQSATPVAAAPPPAPPAESPRPVPPPLAAPVGYSSGPSIEAAQRAPAGAAQRLFDTMHGSAVPLTPRPSAGTAKLASLLVRSGSLKGTRLQVRVPVVNIGRADYNDLVIPEESVSTSHAKLQRRETVWVITDLGSTNGTFVDGERIAGEAPLSPGASLRFGEVLVMFEPTDDDVAAEEGGGTKVLGAYEPPAPRAASPAPPAPAPPRAGAAGPPRSPPSKPTPRKLVVMTPPRRGLPKWVIPVVVLVILAAAAAILLIH
jgi:pSer/pThr/pTyr-binding forkhead associated (FHA) protein